MVEQQLKSMGVEADKATSDQKKEAEEAVDKMLKDQMVLDALAEKLDVQVSQSDVFNFLGSIAQQYGMDPNMFIRASCVTARSALPSRKWPVPRACSPACVR